MKHELHPDQSNLSRHLYRVRLRTWVSRYIGERWHHVSVKRRRELEAGAIADSRKFSDHKRWQPDHGRGFFEGSREDVMDWRTFMDRMTYPGSVAARLASISSHRAQQMRDYGSTYPERKLYTAEVRPLR